ncbi:hypothetical protein L1987_61192 [Smallanthus sonchifolius]|uniref:Uncharacterized protein n=1 Tax=Smallanthus sonchifolius TaxID=185202 RepID=A0ACB9DA67_9ASTR|nr:hypothetical protein L1987_61192 [Smallanthus sonchifolius]
MILYCMIKKSMLHQQFVRVRPKERERHAKSSRETLSPYFLLLRVRRSETMITFRRVRLVHRLLMMV